VVSQIVSPCGYLTIQIGNAVGYDIDVFE